MTYETHECHSQICKERDPLQNKCIMWVKWSDAYFQGGETMWLSSIIHEVLIETVGIMVKETETHVSLAMEVYPIKETFRNVISIPKGMILDSKRFPLPTGEAEK